MTDIAYKPLALADGSTMLQPDFIYGAGTSSFQIEGAADQRLPCIWDTFCERPGTIADNSNGNVACDHVVRLQEDLRLIESLGLDAYRFSIAWARVVNADGSANEAGLQWYIDLLDGLAARGIKAFVTLYHWDLPQFIEDQGGWLNRNTSYLFRDYADLVSRAFGHRVYSYATLNEPMCSAYLGYEVGVHAPGEQDKTMAHQAAHHLLLAHGLAMGVLERNCPDALNGIVLNFAACYPFSNNSADHAAARYAHDYLYDWYLAPIMTGQYPDVIDALPAAELPDIQPDDMDIIQTPINFLGINFYTRELFRADAEQGFVKVEPEEAMPRTDMGWEIYPQGLTDMLVSLRQRYELPPIYITENGAAFADQPDSPVVHDPERIDYIQRHLQAVEQAIMQGVRIDGYFCWSLMDNFEWAFGYEKRFGIIHVDFDTMARSLKTSALAYRDLIAARNAGWLDKTSSL